ncbi:hypothetical protein GQ457_09G009650 [Hibiscus cannabinus]
MIMQRFPVKNNVLDSESTTKFGFGGNEQPVCPKPRRLVGPAAVPEFLKPLRCTKHSQSYTDGRCGVLNMIAVKTSEGRESSCCGCWPSCSSPPGRTGNPLVHDVHFVHQMERLSPFGRPKFSDKFGITSASPV